MKNDSNSGSTWEALKEQWFALAKRYVEFKRKPSVRLFLKFIVPLARLLTVVLIRRLIDKFFG